MPPENEKKRPFSCKIPALQALIYMSGLPKKDFGASR